MMELISARNYVKQCLKLKSHEVIKILDDYRRLGDIPAPTQKDETILISLKIPESLLKEFKSACASKNLKYQSQIKVLMKEWLER